MNRNRITMNGKGKIITDKNVNLAQGKVIETDKARKLREERCHNGIAKLLKFFDCNFSVEVRANVKK